MPFNFGPGLKALAPRLLMPYGSSLDLIRYLTLNCSAKGLRLLFWCGGKFGRLWFHLIVQVTARCLWNNIIAKALQQIVGATSAIMFCSALYVLLDVIAPNGYRVLILVWVLKKSSKCSSELVLYFVNLHHDLCLYVQNFLWLSDISWFCMQRQVHSPSVLWSDLQQDALAGTVILSRLGTSIRGLRSKRLCQDGESCSGPDFRKG